MDTATDIARHGHKSSPLPPLFLFTDPKRTPVPLHIAKHLPEGTGIIYRHFGDPEAFDTACALKTIANERNLKLFIGEDIDLALKIKADGVHLRDQNLERALDIRHQYPQLNISGACHSIERLKTIDAKNFDGLFISPIFQSQSPSAIGVFPIGLEGIKAFCALSPVAIYGLGGIGPENAKSLITSGLAGFGAIDTFN
jgi:thiamine-phosphate pyrophosphorylase